MMNQTATKTNTTKILKKKPRPAEDPEPERSPTPTLVEQVDEQMKKLEQASAKFMPSINEEMVEFFKKCPEGDFTSPEKQRELAQFVVKATTKKLSKGINTKGKTKAEIKGYASTQEAEALGYFNKGDTCPDCGKIFNRKFFKAYHWISKDNQRCDGVVKRSNGKKQGVVRPKVVAKATDWITEWSKTAVDFGLIDEPLTFSSKDLTRWILEEEYKEELDEVITLKPFKKKLAHFLNNTNIVEKTTYETDDGEEFVKCVGDYKLIEIVYEKDWFEDKWMDIKEFCGY
jgi:hypothetical protein